MSDFRFATVEEAVERLKAGQMLILVDDEDRENEGDFVIAGEFVTPEAITIMNRYASGIITVPMNAERLHKLEIPLMVRENAESMRTAFTVTVDAAVGSTTGSSAYDRVVTIQKLADPNSKPEDFNRPGHVNPLKARNGGVLKRAGHTEAMIDLLKIAELQPVGVISEIMDDDGKMSRLPDLIDLAAKFEMPILTIADIIKYRRRTEKLIRRVGSAKLPTKHGEFQVYAYESDVDPAPYVAFVMGDVDDGEECLVRIHSSCVTGDVIGSLRCDCGDQLQLALKKIGEKGRGVLLYIEQEGRGIGITNKIRAYELQDQGADTVEANLRLGFKADLRDYGLGAQVLYDLGVRKMRLMTNNPAKRVGIEGYGLEIVGREPLEIEANEINRKYLVTKRDKMGHLLDDEYLNPTR